MEAVICLNKMDLADTTQREAFSDAFANYEKLGYRVLYTSINAPESLEGLQQVLKG